LDASGAVAATAWSAGAALASSFMITGVDAAGDPAKCTCVAVPQLPPAPPSLAEARTALTLSGMVVMTSALN
jgi:hypothetical protein